MKRHASAMVLRPTLYLLAMSTLAACGNLTGLEGSSKFSCKAPEGVHCSSVTANYYNRAASTDGGVARSGDAPAMAAIQPPVPLNGLDPMALRSPVRVLRLWIKAWEDSDRDLVDQSHVYVRVDDGHWLVQHVQRVERDQYAPLRPPASQPGSQAAAAPGTAPPKDGTVLPNGAMTTPPVLDAVRP